MGGAVCDYCRDLWNRFLQSIIPGQEIMSLSFATEGRGLQKGGGGNGSS